MSRSYDVVVLGAGNAGLAAARVTREAGRSVAVVEGRAVGGTCPLRGCVPKKVLVAAAETLDAIAGAGVQHIEIGAPRLDWSALIARERSFTEGVPEAFAQSLARRGIDLLRGRARFTGPREVVVDGETLSAGKIVVASGSRPRELPLPGAEHLITSEDILNLEALPESLVFIGGGAIALEFSHVLARAGCRVTILEAAPRILPALEEAAVERLREATERLGIEVLTDVEVAAISAASGGLEVGFTRQGEERTLTAALVANGAGRVADVEGLDLDAGQVAHEGPRIEVTEHLRSVSNPDVYAAGDALAGSAQLSPLATYEGRLAGENIVHGDRRVPEYRSVPSVVFSVPALASVGLTEAQAREQGLRFDARETDMRGWLSARLYGSETAYAKVLVEKDSSKILGAHLVGKRAEELIHLFAMAMRFDVSADALGSMVYVFPTFASDVPSMI